MGIKQKLKNVLASAALAGALVGSGCAPIYYSPKQSEFIPNLAPPTQKEVVELLKDECDIVHIDQMASEKNDKQGIETLLACEKKIEEKKYATEWRVNLSDVCRVYVRGNHTPIVHWLHGDDVFIHTGSLHVYSIRLWDKTAKTLGDIIHLYMTQNIAEGKCGHYFNYTRGHYSMNRPLNDEEKNRIKQGYAVLMPLNDKAFSEYQFGLAYFAKKNKDFSFQSSQQNNEGEIVRKYEQGKITESGANGTTRNGRSIVLLKN